MYVFSSEFGFLEIQFFKIPIGDDGDNVNEWEETGEHSVLSIKFNSVLNLGNISLNF